MMRRGRWLAAGAVLGALGYQRLHRATRSLASQSDPGSAARQAAGPVGVAASAAGVAVSAAGRAAGATGWLVRQVRRRRTAERRRHGGVAVFIADVREGMDDYLDRHKAYINPQHRRSGNTLVGQRAPDQAADPGGPGGAHGPRPGAGGSGVSLPRAGTAGRLRQDDETKDGR